MKAIIKTTIVWSAWVALSAGAIYSGYENAKLKHELVIETIKVYHLQDIVLANVNIGEDELKTLIDNKVILDLNSFYNESEEERYIAPEEPVFVEEVEEIDELQEVEDGRHELRYL